MGPDSFQTRVKRISAIHEAGHRTVAESDGNVRFPFERRISRMYRKPLRSRCEFHPAANCAATAVAGLVAECLQKVPEADAWEILECWEMGFIDSCQSAAERLLESREVRVQAIEQAIAILRQRDDRFQAHLAALYKQSIVSK